MTREKYANPGRHLDTDDHQRLIEENKLAYMKERADRLHTEIRKHKTALEVVADEDERDRLKRAIEQMETKLDELAEQIEHERPRR